MWIFQFGGEANETNFSTTVKPLYLEALLHYIHDFCNGTRCFHMVNMSFMLINLRNYQFGEIRSRFPEIIVQLRMFDGPSSTLCDIVRPKPTANATEQAYEFIYMKIRLSQILNARFHFRCNIDNKNIQPFQLLFLIGISFLVMSAIASFSLKKIEPKKLVCKKI